MIFFNFGCCRFDGWDAKHHGYQTISQCQKICDKDSDCIACDVARHKGNKWDCYTFNGTGANFRTECSTVDNMCYKKAGMTHYTAKQLNR